MVLEISREDLRKFGAAEWRFDRSKEPPVQVRTSFCVGTETIGGPKIGHKLQLVIIRYGWTGDEREGYWKPESEQYAEWFDAEAVPREYLVDGNMIPVGPGPSSNLCSDCSARRKEYDHHQ